MLTRGSCRTRWPKSVEWARIGSAAMEVTARPRRFAAVALVGLVMTACLQTSGTAAAAARARPAHQFIAIPRTVRDYASSGAYLDYATMPPPSHNDRIRF